MDAYNVKLVDDNGKLLVDDPKVKQGLVNGADATTPQPYAKGCTPPSSTTLEGSGQQRRLPQQDDRDDAQRDDLDRRQVARRRQQRDAHRRAARRRRKKNYDELIATAGFPNKPDGSPMVYRAAVKIGVIFEASKNKKRGQGVRDVPAAGGEPDARTSRARSAAGSR